MEGDAEQGICNYLGNQGSAGGSPSVLNVSLVAGNSLIHGKAEEGAGMNGRHPQLSSPSLAASPFLLQGDALVFFSTPKGRGCTPMDHSDDAAPQMDHSDDAHPRWTTQMMLHPRWATQVMLTPDGPPR